MKELQWGFLSTPSQIAEDKKLSLVEKVVFSSLFSKMNDEAVEASQKEIAKEWALDLEDVQRAVRDLEKLGYMEYIPEERIKIIS